MTPFSSSTFHDLSDFHDLLDTVKIVYRDLYWKVTSSKNGPKRVQNHSYWLQALLGDKEKELLTRMLTLWRPAFFSPGLAKHLSINLCDLASQGKFIDLPEDTLEDFKACSDWITLG